MLRTELVTGPPQFVAVVGMGKLGLPLAAVLSSVGYNVTGIDTDPDTVAAINNREAPTTEPDVQQLLEAHPFKATNDATRAATVADVTIVLVPTPSNDNGSFDSSHVVGAVTAVAAGINRRSRRNGYPIVAVSSTVSPGTCDGAVTDALSAAGLRVGIDVGLVYSPEFIALGSVVNDLLNPDQVLIGASDHLAASAMADVYGNVADDAPQQIMSLIDAEVTKLAVNNYICMKLSFANTIAAVCESLPGANAHRVCDAVGADHRIGNDYFRPGAPYSGPCLPRDVHAFAALNVEPWLPKAADQVNRNRQTWIEDAIRAAQPSPTHWYNVGVLGLSYKPGTPVTDEAPGPKILEWLDGTSGIGRMAHDPAVESLPGNHRMVGVAQILDEADTVVVATPHAEYRGLSPREGQTFIDLWGITDPGPGQTIRVGV